MNKFWMVMRDDCSNFAKRRHDNLDSAVQEAQRLSAKEGSTFIILEAIEGVRPKSMPVERIELTVHTLADDLPF